MTEIIKMLEISGPAILLVLAGLVWGKKLIEYFFDETIEIKKDELKQNLENHKKNIEQENRNFQHQLDTKLNEFNIQFSKLHVDRAEVVKNIYAKLIELQSAMFVFTRRMHGVIHDSEKESKERADRLNKALFDFISYYSPNRLYFNEDLAEKLDKIKAEYWEKGWDFSLLSKELKQSSDFPVYRKKLMSDTKVISENVERDFPVMIKEIEIEFRNILGVE